MNALRSIAAVGFVLIGAVGSASAQPYGGYDRGYREPEFRDRGPRYEERERGPRRDREYAFDEREYLRCNPDVRRAINRGEMESASVHYRRHGRREGRQLSC